MIPMHVNQNVIKYVVIKYRLNNTSKNFNSFKLCQCWPSCQDQWKNQHVQIDVEVTTNAKLECHVDFDNLVATQVPTTYYVDIVLPKNQPPYLLPTYYLGT